MAIKSYTADVYKGKEGGYIKSVKAKADGIQNARKAIVKKVGSKDAIRMIVFTPYGDPNELNLRPVGMIEHFDDRWVWRAYESALVGRIFNPKTGRLY